MASGSSVGVVGGGLGGLAAACVAAARGHKVTLYDKNGWVGGKAAVLHEGGFPQRALVLVGLDDGPPQLPHEVDGVLVGLLPLEDVGIGAGLVLAAEAGEDEAVVAVTQLLDDILEHHLDAVGDLHVLHLDEEGLEVTLLRVLPEQLLIGPEDLFLEVTEAFGQLS